MTWDAPTTNEDGSDITDLGGFRIYCGSQPRDYDVVIDVGLVTEHTLELPAGDRFYLAVTAYDFGGLESVFSGEVAFTP